VPLANEFVLRNLCEYRHTSYIALKKLDSSAYIFVADIMGLSPNTFTYLAHKDAEFGKITKNNGHYAVKGHLRSMILVLIESLCALPISTK